MSLLMLKNTNRLEREFRRRAGRFSCRLLCPFVQTGHQLCTSVVAHKWMLPRCIGGLLDKNRFKAVNESQQWSKKHQRG
jgi:hypothetical protein